jgi:uncharacterized MAPEG superfamily protein
VAGKTGGAGAIGAELWFGARILYVAAYVSGIPYLRTAVWSVAVLGLLLMVFRLLA